MTDYFLDAKALANETPKTSSLNKAQINVLKQNLSMALEPCKGQKKGRVVIHVKADLYPQTMKWLCENTKGFTFIADRSRGNAFGQVLRAITITWGN